MPPNARRISWQNLKPGMRRSVSPCKLNNSKPRPKSTAGSCVDHCSRACGKKTARGLFIPSTNLPIAAAWTIAYGASGRTTPPCQPPICKLWAAAMSSATSPGACPPFRCPNLTIMSSCTCCRLWSLSHCWVLWRPSRSPRPWPPRPASGWTPTGSLSARA